jgi:hypothetical protein
MMATGEKPKEPRGRSETLRPSQKTLRHFYCRDDLWEACDALASDFECSIDYIINEAMRHYARSKNYYGPEKPNKHCIGTPTPTPTPPEQTYPPGTLFLEFEGKRHPIVKDQFTIGRGSKASDLPIRDSNISRKHAIVMRRHGTYYIKDLGSTNGIGFQGTRIDNKRIDEGDIFYICDHELRFTYRS